MIRKLLSSNEKSRRNLVNRWGNNNTHSGDENAQIDSPDKKDDIIEKEEQEMIFKPLKNPRNRSTIKEWKRITDKDTIFVSFVSDPFDSNFYSSKIPSLVSKLEEFGYDYLIRQYTQDRTYHQNCCFKPVFINSVMKEFGKNIVWIDVDTNIKMSLDNFFSTENFDIGVVSHNGDINGFFASPLLIKNTVVCNDLLDSWDNHCTEKIELGICELDHDALKHSIIPNYRGLLKIKLFDNRYNQGDVLENINSVVPLKTQVHREISRINLARPFNYTNKDFIII